MIEKKPDSFSDIVDRAMGELRSSPVPPELPPELLEALLQAAKENAGGVQCTVEASAQAEIVHPTFPTHSLTNWKWITRSSVSRIAAAAAVLAFAVAGVALWFHVSGTTPAFADFLQPILDARTMKFKVRSGDGQTSATGEVMIMAPYRAREEHAAITKSGKTAVNYVIITDVGQGKGIQLFPDTKRAIITTYTNMPKEEFPTILLELRSELREARDSPGWTREPLGEKTIDGRRLVGFRLTGRGEFFNLWGDPQTGMPIRIEATAGGKPGMKPVILSDFVLDLPLDESLFSLEPPAGYTVEHLAANVTRATEKDLLETFRRYRQLSGGALPDKLDLNAMRFFFMQNWRKSHPDAEGIAMQKVLGNIRKAAVVFDFIRQSPRSADAHYSVAGMKSGAAGAPAVWARETKGARKYQVVYGDLSIRQTDAPPNVPDAQPVVDYGAFMERYFAFVRLRGGKNIEESRRAKETPSDLAQTEKEDQQQADELHKLTHGLTFACRELPREADAHYAGKGVSLGTADRPIFWYRPKDAKKYRVIYADLSVRESDTPPNVSNAQPVPAASGPKE